MTPQQSVGPNSKDKTRGREIRTSGGREGLEKQTREAGGELTKQVGLPSIHKHQIGRASCRERVSSPV